jgi:hypothetical protein
MLSSSNIIKFNKLYEKLIYYEFLVKLNLNNTNNTNNSISLFLNKDFNYLQDNFNIFNNYLLNENNTNNNIQLSHLSLILYKPFNIKIIDHFDLNIKSNYIINLNDYFKTINNSYLIYNIINTDNNILHLHEIKNYHELHLKNNYIQKPYYITISIQNNFYNEKYFKEIQIIEFKLPEIIYYQPIVNIILGKLNQNTCNINILNYFSYNKYSNINLISYSNLSYSNVKYYFNNNLINFTNTYNSSDIKLLNKSVDIYLTYKYNDIIFNYSSNFIKFNIYTSPIIISKTFNINLIDNKICNLSHYYNNRQILYISNINTEYNSYYENNNDIILTPNYRHNTYSLIVNLDDIYSLYYKINFIITEPDALYPLLTEKQLLLETVTFNNIEKIYDLNQLFINQYKEKLIYEYEISKIIKENKYFNNDLLLEHKINLIDFIEIRDDKLIIKPNYRNIIYEINIYAINQYNKRSDKKITNIIENKLIKLKSLSKKQYVLNNKLIHINLKNYYYLINDQYYYIKYNINNKYDNGYLDLNNHIYYITPNFRNTTYNISFQIIYDNQNYNQYDTNTFNINIIEEKAPSIEIYNKYINIDNLKNIPIYCNLEHLYNYRLSKNNIKYYINNNYNSNYIKLDNNFLIYYPNFRNISNNININIHDTLYNTSNNILFKFNELHPIYITNINTDYYLNYKSIYIDLNNHFNNYNNSLINYNITNNIYTNITLNNNILTIIPNFSNIIYYVNINAIDNKYNTLSKKIIFNIIDNELPPLDYLIPKINLNLYKYEYYKYKLPIKYDLNKLINYPEHRKLINYDIFYTDKQTTINKNFIYTSNNYLIINIDNYDLSVLNGYNIYFIKDLDYKQITTKSYNFSHNIINFYNNIKHFDYELYIDNNFISSNLIYNIDYYNNLNYIIYISILSSNIEYDSKFYNIQEPKPYFIKEYNEIINYNKNNYELINLTCNIIINDDNLNIDNFYFNIDYNYCNYFNFYSNNNQLNIFLIKETNIFINNNNLLNINTSNILTPYNQFKIKININIDDNNYSFKNSLYYNIKY